MTRVVPRWSLLLALALIASACDPIPSSYQRIGASLADDGRTVEILYSSCASELVHAVRLEDLGEESGLEDDTVLWRITSAEGSGETTSFVVGVTPDGFEEDVSFSGGINDNDGLIVSVETNGNTPSVQFTLADLAGGGVAINDSDEAVDRDAYLTRAEESCAR